MTLKLAKGNTANPTLWTTYRSEIFRWRKHRFYKFVVAGPFVLALILTAMVVLLSGRSTGGVPRIDIPTAYDLGSQGAFVYASEIFLMTIAGFCPLILILACTWNVVNEYNWKTIKMIATRQPSRVQIVLGKCLFATTVIAAIYVSFILGWLTLSFGLKIIFSEPLTLASYDVDAIWKGLGYFAMWCLGNLIWGFLAISLAFQSKSLVPAIIGYGLYSIVDNLVSAAGATLINGGDRAMGELPAWLQGIMHLIKFVHPVLLNSNLNRITQKAGSLTMVSSLPLWWSWAMLVVYIVLFTGLGILVFARRDVTE